MFSANQTETSHNTNSTEQPSAPLSKNQRRKLEREQSRNWFGFSHREYEGVLYRGANKGRKRYEDTVAQRMAAKKAARLAKKQTNNLPNKVATTQMPKVASDVVVMNRYSNTPVVYKWIHDTLVVLTYLDGDSTKHTTVYHIKDNKATLKKASRAQKYTDDELVAKNWKTATLGDDEFAPILALLMETEDIAAAA